MRYALISALEVAYKMSCEVLVLVGDKRESRSLLAGTTRPTDAMCVSVNVASDVVVDDRPYVRDVQSARYTHEHIETVCSRTSPSFTSLQRCAEQKFYFGSVRIRFGYCSHLLLM